MAFSERTDALNIAAESTAPFRPAIYFYFWGILLLRGGIFRNFDDMLVAKLRLANGTAVSSTRTILPTSYLVHLH